jgi:hypothetical protein
MLKIIFSTCRYTGFASLRRILKKFPKKGKIGSWEFGGQLSADNDCPRTIFEIVRCPWNTRTILEFRGQFYEKKLNF